MGHSPATEEERTVNIMFFSLFFFSKWNSQV